MKGLVLILLALIIGSLAKAMASMSAGGGIERSRAVARALTVRISLSVALFILLIAGNHYGWITPR